MSVLLDVKGEVFDSAPAFTIRTNHDEMSALLELACERPLVLAHVGGGDFLLHVQEETSHE